MSNTLEAIAKQIFEGAFCTTESQKAFWRRPGFAGKQEVICVDTARRAIQMVELEQRELLKESLIALDHAASMIAELEYHWHGTDERLWGPIKDTRDALKDFVAITSDAEKSPQPVKATG